VNPAARVVPDVASFSVDDGFWYSIPDHLRPDLHIGSIVRVPLSGRRVRGWVVEVADDHAGELKDVAGISGSHPVFDRVLARGLIWAARHYVAPLATLLGRATPPNLPRATPGPAPIPAVSPVGHPISEVVDRSASGLVSPTTAIVGNWHDLRWLSDLGRLFSNGKSVLVVAASAAECTRLASFARALWGDLVAEVSGEDDAADTAAWERAQAPPRLVIGTPKTATWLVAGLALAIVVEESRRAMKDRQTPTLHVRDVMITRSRLEGFNLVFFGPTPGVELLATGAEVVKVGNRAWPLVEVVDRSEDAPGGGFLAARTVAAIAATASSGHRVFVFTHRRRGFASSRCARCRALHTCAQCGFRLGRVERCPKCKSPAGPCSRCGGTEFEEMGTVPDRLIAELDRRIGAGAAQGSPADGPVIVGTERDLAGLDEVHLAVAADVDGMLTGVGYRTTEEALRQLARLASKVGEGQGARLMLQTSHPDSALITTMRRGDPIPYLERVLVERGREGMPPSTEMIAVEVRGQVPGDVADDLRSLDAGAAVLGPMRLEDGQRWLLSGKLGKARNELRTLVGRWRDRGATVRVDADPIDV
jgi:primosomal protein N' (replication factor Y)